MEEFKIDYKFNLKDFIRIEDIEHSYFENDIITSAKETQKWYRKNKFTCIGVRNSDNEIIASVNVLPLNKEIFYAIYNDKMNESDIKYSQIEKYEDNNEYYIYLSSISIDKRYRNNYKVISTLLRGCIDLLDILLRRNIKFNMVMAEACTIHGEKICKKMLKMDYIRDTNQELRLYVEEGEKFIASIGKLRKLLYRI